MSETSDNIIDWELAEKLAHNDRAFAKEMVNMLIDTLPEHLEILTNAYQARDWQRIEQETHKLYGATCYCGTPRLKEAAKKLELALTENPLKDSTALYHHLIEEINLLLNYKK